MHSCFPALEIFHRTKGAAGERNIPGLSVVSLTPGDKQQHHSPVFFPPSPAPLGSDLPTPKDIKMQAYWLEKLLYSLKTTVMWRAALSQALQCNMLARNCYSSWFDVPVARSVDFFFSIVGQFCRIQSDAAVLVDPLKALRVLHGHEELLSQVLKRVVGWQIQAVETGKKRKCFTVRFDFHVQRLKETMLTGQHKHTMCELLATYPVFPTARL